MKKYPRALYVFVKAAFCLIFYFSPSGYAQKKNAEIIGFGWIAERGTDRILLLPSVHFGRQENSTLPPWLVKAITQAKQVAFETDVASSDFQERKKACKGNALEVLNVKYSNEIKSAVLAYSYERLSRNFVDTLIYKTMPDNDLAYLLLVSLIELEDSKKNLVNAKYGMEYSVSHLIRRDQQSVIELEDICDDRENILLSKQDSDRDISFNWEFALKARLESLRSQAHLSSINDFWNAWSASDWDAYRSKYMTQAKDMSSSLVGNKRHQKMMSSIEKLDQKNNLPVVVIGALHFIGKNSILDLLEQKGYTVKAYPPIEISK